MSKLRPLNAKYDVILASFTWAISEKESVQLYLIIFWFIVIFY